MANLVDSSLDILNSLKGTELDVNVVLMEKEFEIGELTKLNPGSILMFDTKEDTSAKVAANGKTIAYGDVVQIGEFYGLRVTELVG